MKKLRRPRPPTRKPGRPPKAIDLDRVRGLARKGFDSISEIGRHIGIPKQTMLNATHGSAVKEAFDRGRLEAKERALEQYEKAIARSNGNLTGLLIFKMKQFGWTDRVQHAGTIEVTDGARERILEKAAGLAAKWEKEGRKAGA